MEPKGQNGKPPHQLTWRSFQGLLHRNNVVVHLIVLFLGHLQIGLQMFAEVPHGLPHHLPKTLLDLADGRELVQSKLVVPNLTTESFTICHGDGRILSRFITCWYICRKQPHSQVASPVVRVQQRWAGTGGLAPHSRCMTGAGKIWQGLKFGSLVIRKQVTKFLVWLSSQLHFGHTTHELLEYSSLTTAGGLL